MVGPDRSPIPRTHESDQIVDGPILRALLLFAVDGFGTSYESSEVNSPIKLSQTVRRFQVLRQIYSVTIIWYHSFP